MTYEQLQAECTANAASVSVSLGLCPLRTKRGETCGQKLLEDLPCCFNHFGVWAVSSDANLLRAFEARATSSVDAVRSSQGRVVLVSLRRVNRAEQYGWGNEFIRLRLSAEQAQVVADLLDSLGNSAAATKLLQAVARIAAPASLDEP